MWPKGITTIIVGQDGGSRFPREEGDSIRRYESFADFQSAVRELQPAVNVASMIGLGTLRAVVATSSRHGAFDHGYWQAISPSVVAGVTGVAFNYLIPAAAIRACSRGVTNGAPVESMTRRSLPSNLCWRFRVDCPAM